jgi:seryl-tRNA synthetase
MYDIKWIREHRDELERALARRQMPVQERQRLINSIFEQDVNLRSLKTQLQMQQSNRNEISKSVARAKSQGAESVEVGLRQSLILVRTKIQNLEERERGLAAELNTLLAEIPNLPADDVPDGKDEHDNVEHHRFGAKRDYAFTPRQHFELGEALGQMDFETAVKLSGARFVVLKSGLARLERALGQFMLDLHTNEHGYTEVNPPLLVRDEAMFGTAQLPKFREDQFLARSPIKRGLLFDQLSTTLQESPEPIARIALAALAGVTIEEQGMLGNVPMDEFVKLRQQLSIGSTWLIPTAEVPLTNLVRESILDEEQLPLRFTACTPCFRAEAGAAGKDTRGMIRQHQFTKVELVSITAPEQSRDEHERMLSCAEEVLRRLDLHYRVVTLCTGDMGFASQRTYDIEVWLPGQGMYREISSCSVCGEFQARRMQARYRGKDGKVKGPVHTLNGSGVAVGRALIAVLENYQQEDGSIAVPDVLQPYMGGVKTIGRA